MRKLTQEQFQEMKDIDELLEVINDDSIKIDDKKKKKNKHKKNNKLKNNNSIEKINENEVSNNKGNENNNSNKIETITRTNTANIMTFLSDSASKRKIDMVNIQNILFNFSLMAQNQNANEKFVSNPGLISDELSITESNSTISPIYGMKSNNKFDTILNIYNMKSSNNLSPTMRSFNSRIPLDGNKPGITWKQIQSNTMLKPLPKNEIKTCQNSNSHINSKPMINLLNSKLLLQNINNNINNNKNEGEPSKE